MGKGYLRHIGWIAPKIPKGIERMKSQAFLEWKSIAQRQAMTDLYEMCSGNTRESQKEIQ